MSYQHFGGVLAWENRPKVAKGLWAEGKWHRYYLEDYGDSFHLVVYPLPYMFPVSQSHFLPTMADCLKIAEDFEISTRAHGWSVGRNHIENQWKIRDDEGRMIW